MKRRWFGLFVLLSLYTHTTYRRILPKPKYIKSISKVLFLNLKWFNCSLSGFIQAFYSWHNEIVYVSQICCISQVFKSIGELAIYTKYRFLFLGIFPKKKKTTKNFHISFCSDRSGFRNNISVLIIIYFVVV